MHHATSLALCPDREHTIGVTMCAHWGPRESACSEGSELCMVALDFPGAASAGHIDVVTTVTIVEGCSRSSLTRGKAEL